MICKGYKLQEHETLKLHAHGLCQKCYMRQWRDLNRSAIIKYQKDYREDPAYAAMNRIAVNKWRSARNG